ncbi:hypothetical protein [Streptomyces sp. H27-D2]|uniref:hypothetical protein n=1 Tax=Streptomyces sp. H27-D2 TaxID=3046304 RepID=UPI002DB94FB6|nr:hypothetical protein [Streptomyces sp. H27-D2]MEC4017171.1 hypothetical protein [Streptomyces sp. H27-D2]
MTLPDRKEDEVRRMLDGPHPPVPPELAQRATERGRRMARRRRVARIVLWLLLTAALTALALWAATDQPWLPPPADTTPPLEGW